MNTPICDFVKSYTEKNTVRFHMPGHKGKNILGFENFDITEIMGADSLYEASTIIAESEKNASALFGCDTYYSTEGSSLCIRAMLYLATIYAKNQNKELVVFAGRNAHKTFVSSSALLGFDVEWLGQDTNSIYHSFTVDIDLLESTLSKTNNKTKVVYITSPDYLGNISDIKKIADVCHKNDALLIVDNAHGAYLRFLDTSLHPIDLGADLCCDSAHKTLPVLTGGAYLHISNKLPALFNNHVKEALSLFGSTSPSYLILQSLDIANKYLCENIKSDINNVCVFLDKLRSELVDKGFTLYGNEKLKITIQTKKYGYMGYEFADILRNNNIECEFSDPDFVVLMLSASSTEEELLTLEKTLLDIQKKAKISTIPPTPSLPVKNMSIREATLSVSESLPVKECIGKTVAISTASCPPAIPIVVPGEVVDEHSIKLFEYYGIENIFVIKE